MKPEELRAVVESILFVSEEPQSANRIAQVLDGVELSDVKRALDEIREACEAEERGVHLFEVAGGYQMGTKENCRPFLDKFFEKRRRMRMSTAALETLAIVAYRQPLTRAEIEAIRGVNVDGVVHSLLERRLIKIAGRKEVPGQPFLYRTTREFLQHFGLRSLSDLPQIEVLMKAFTSSGAGQETETGGEEPAEGGEARAAGSGEDQAPEDENDRGGRGGEGQGAQSGQSGGAERGDDGAAVSGAGGAPSEETGGERAADDETGGEPGESAVSDHGGAEEREPDSHTAADSQPGESQAASGSRRRGEKENHGNIGEGPAEAASPEVGSAGIDSPEPESDGEPSA